MWLHFALLIKKTRITAETLVKPCLPAVVGLGLGGPEARLKRGPSDDVIILSQP